MTGQRGSYRGKEQPKMQYNLAGRLTGRGGEEGGGQPGLLHGQRQVRGLRLRTSWRNSVSFPTSPCAQADILNK